MQSQLQQWLNSPYPMSRKLVGSPTYLTAANINLLTERIIVGESGSDLERSLDAMAHVTSPSYLASIGSDFMREDALFAVIFMSDEIDQSSEFGNSNSFDLSKYQYNSQSTHAHHL